MKKLALAVVLAIGVTMIAPTAVASAHPGGGSFRSLHPGRSSAHWPGRGAPPPLITDTLSFAAPAEVDVDQRTGRVFVANDGDSTVAVLDGRTHRTIATIPVGDGPGSTVFDGNRIYEANSWDGTISVIDARTYKVVKTIDTGQLYGQQLVVNHRLRKLYVAVYRSPVLVYDLDSLRLIGSIPDDDTNFIAINERTDTVYVTNYDDATVGVIDSRTDQLVATVQVGPAAYPDDCYETDTCIVNPAGPDGVAVNTRTNRIYVDNVITGNIVTIDGRTNTIAGTIQTLPGQFWSTVDEDTNLVYSTNFAESTLSVVDGRTNRLVDTVKIGDGFSPPGCFSNQATCTDFGAGSSSLAISPITGEIYVPNFNINTLTVLSTRRWLPRH